MVVSKIEPMIEYIEDKEIANNDIDTEVSMYELKFLI